MKNEKNKNVKKLINWKIWTIRKMKQCEKWKNGKLQKTKKIITGKYE